MADEFSIFGSFGGGSTYNPFGGLASSGTPSLNSTLSATGTTPVATGVGESSGSDGWGGVIKDAFSTAVNWGSQVLAFDLFGRAQEAGINTGTNQTTGGSGSNTGGTASAGANAGASSGSMIAGVPPWLVYGGGGLLLLLVVLKLLKG